jgi:hypothetical protein
MPFRFIRIHGSVMYCFSLDCAAREIHRVQLVDQHELHPVHPLIELRIKVAVLDRGAILFAKQWHHHFADG